jgi:hypothetical protein
MTHFDLDDYVDFLKQKNIQDVKIKEYISNSYYKNKWFSRNQKMNIDQNTSYLNAQLLQKEFKNKKVIGVFPHIFWDSTAIYGEDLFENYYEWFVKILNYIELCSNPNRVWIIKLHPDLIFKVNKYNFKMLKLNKKLKTLQKKNLNVKILWPGYNILTTHLLDMIDVCLTVRGTVGIESALKGKATFTAGTGRYSNRGFTIDSNSIKNYLNLLTNLEDYVESSEKLITEAESYAKVIFLALPFKFSQPVFNTDKKGLCPFNDSINNLTDQDYANFKNWYDSEFELFKNLRF